MAETVSQVLAPGPYVPKHAWHWVRFGHHKRTDQVVVGVGMAATCGFFVLSVLAAMAPGLFYPVYYGIALIYIFTQLIELAARDYWDNPQFYFDMGFTGLAALAGTMLVIAMAKSTRGLAPEAISIELRWLTILWVRFIFGIMVTNIVVHGQYHRDERETKAH